MQKVISVNLNGHAYQLEEDGYISLREYLARAEQALSGNPDRTEIVADLEQAIADKCQRYLSPHKTVVTSSEVSAIVAEMGPVEGAAGESAQAASSPDGSEPDAQAAAAPRRLYRIMDGAIVAGVCNGIAAFFRIDVTLVRIGFALTALLTKGAGILAYVVAMIVVPEATTAEARAAGSGAPINAQEVIERARKQYAAGRKEWQRRWRQQRRQWRRSHYWGPGAPNAYAPPLWSAGLLPLFALIHIGLFVAMGAMLISLVNTGAILDWELPPDIPLWAGALMLLVGYQIAVSPLRAFERWHALPRPGVEPGWLAFSTTVTWLVGAAFVVWIASNHIPEIREFLQRLPELVRDFAYAVRDVFTRDREGAR